MIDELQQQFQSMIKALDVFYVLKDLKLASRIIINEEDLSKHVKFLESFGLKTAVSDFKIKTETEPDKDFTNKGLRIDKKSNQQGSFFVYVSKNKLLAEEARHVEEKNNHEKLGISLGYPKCCSQFFERNFEKESKRYNDYILAALQNSDGFEFPYKNNYCVRNFDLSLISHFPCKFNCKESLKIANRNLLEIKKDNKDVATILDGMLKGAVLYTENQGIFFLRGIEFDKNKLFYQTVMVSIDNELSKKIREAVCIEVIDKNKVKINNEIIEGTYGVMVFR